MSREAPSARTISKGQSVLGEQPFSRPKLLPVCCLCGLIRDNRDSTPAGERWLTPRTFRRTHGIHPADCVFTHTYCPTCFTKVRDTAAQHFRQIGPSL